MASMLGYTMGYEGEVLELRRCRCRYVAERGGFPPIVLIVDVRGTWLLEEEEELEKDVDRLVLGDALGDLAGGV